MTALIFVGGPLPGPAYTLVFGDAGNSAGLSMLYGSTSLPNVQVQGRSQAKPPPLARLAGDALTGAPMLAGHSLYASHTARPTVNRTAGCWQIAGAWPASSLMRHRSSQACEVNNSARWQAAQPLPVPRAPPWSVTLRSIRPWATLGQQAAQRLPTAALAIAYQQCNDQVRWAGTLYQQEGMRVPTAPMTQWHQDGWRDRRSQVGSRYQQARLHTGRLQREAIQSAVYLRRWWAAYWQAAIYPLPGRHRLAMEPPAAEPCYTPNAHLLFTGGARGRDLLFVCESGVNLARPVCIPIRRVYWVINETSLQRWPDGAPVPVLGFTLSLEADSWAWGFEATLPAIAEPLVVPAAGASPVELVARVNGSAFHVLAEDLSRDRVFGQASIRVSGRGRSALLSAPYAPVMNFANTQPRSARQLMDDVLTCNGIPLGWTVDWALTDWQVPAGVFARQGTWIEALTAIASAAGGYLLPHPCEQIVRVRHRYPVAPWHWSPALMPDFVLPVDAVARESLRWIDKPAYNRVFVSGQETGVLGQVTRAGTAGDALAPMVVDALITEAAAARQRGIAVLSDTGRQIEVTLRLPVLPETAIIEPGAFVAYQDGGVERLGLVRSTRVEAGLPEVWQTLGVQSHA